MNITRKQRKPRFLALVLALSLIFSVMPVGVWATVEVDETAYNAIETAYNAFYAAYSNEESVLSLTLTEAKDYLDDAQAIQSDIADFESDYPTYGNDSNKETAISDYKSSLTTIITALETHIDALETVEDIEANIARLPDESAINSSVDLSELRGYLVFAEEIKAAIEELSSDYTSGLTVDSIISTLKNRIETLEETEISNLTTRINALPSTGEIEVSTNVTALKANLTEAEAIETAINALTSDHTLSVSDILSALNSRIGELETLAGEVTAIENRITALPTTTAIEAGDKDSNLTTLQAEVESIESAISTFESTNSDYTANFSTDKLDEVKDAITARQAVIAGMTTSRADLIAEIEALVDVASLDDSDLETTLASAESLKTKITTFNTSNDATSTIEDISDEDITTVTTYITALNSRITKLETLATEVTAIENRITALPTVTDIEAGDEDSNLTTLQAEVASIQSAISTFESTNSDYTANFSTATLEAVETALTARQAVLDGFDTSNTAIMTRINSLVAVEIDTIDDTALATTLETANTLVDDITTFNSTTTLPEADKITEADITRVTTYITALNTKIALTKTLPYKVEKAENNATITLEAGEYNLTETLTINKPLTITGTGEVTITGSLTITADVTLDHVTVNSTATAITVTNSKLTLNNVIVNGGTTGISVTGTGTLDLTTVTVQNCTTGIHYTTSYEVDGATTADIRANTTFSGNGTDLVIPVIDNPVATNQTTTTGYLSINDAIAEATSNDTILLKKATAEDVVVPKDLTLVLDLNHFTLTNVDDHTITNEGYLVIEGAGTVDNTTNGKAAVYNTGKIELLNGTYTRSAEAGTTTSSDGGNSYYVIYNDGTMTISETVTVTSTSAYSSLIGSGVGDSATLTILGGTFTGGLNTIKNDENSTLIVDGGTFTNTAQHALFNANTATINNGTFIGAAYPLYIGSGSGEELTINGGCFYGTSGVVYYGSSYADGTINLTSNKIYSSHQFNLTNTGNVTVNVTEGYVEKEVENKFDGYTYDYRVIQATTNEDMEELEETIKNITVTGMTPNEALIVNAAAADFVAIVNAMDDDDLEDLMEDEDAMEIIAKLDKLFVAANDTIDVSYEDPVYDDDLDSDDKVEREEVEVVGLALSVFGGNIPAQKQELSLYVLQTEGDDDTVEFKIYPTSEGNKIGNSKLNTPISFKLYLNDNFDSTYVKIIHSSDSYDDESYKLRVEEDSNDQKFVWVTVSHFSIFEVSAYGSSSSSSSSSSSTSYTQDELTESEFWDDVKEAINSASSGDLVRVDAKSYTQFPWTVMEELYQNSDISFVLEWNGGSDIEIPAGTALKSTGGRIYYSFSDLLGIYDGVTTPTIDDKWNPVTGGIIELVAPDPDTLTQITDTQNTTGNVPEVMGTSASLSGGSTVFAMEPLVTTSQNKDYSMLFIGLAVVAVLGLFGAKLYAVKSK